MYTRTQFPPPPTMFSPNRHMASNDWVFGGGFYMPVPVSTTWSAANLAVFSPLLLESAARVTGFFHANGATVNGNIDVGLFTPQGTLIRSTGSTVQTGASVVQVIAPSGGAFSIGPGLYYMGVTSNSAGPTSTARGNTIGNAHVARAAGLLQQTGLFPLANATFQSYASAVIPTSGIVATPIGASFAPAIPPTISPFSIFSVGLNPIFQGFAIVNATSAAWSINQALYHPFNLPFATTLTKAFVMAGATWDTVTPHHFDIGIYSASSGARLFSLGSTAATAAINTLQVVDMPDFDIGPGGYFMALALDSTDATFRVSPTMGGITGIQFQNTAFPLPATATFSIAAATSAPVYGFLTSEQAVI